jgi:hypothetical protein
LVLLVDMAGAFAGANERRHTVSMVVIVMYGVGLLAIIDVVMRGRMLSPQPAVGSM